MPSPSTHQDSPKVPEKWTAWRCTHPLCTRLAQAWEIDHARLLTKHDPDNPRVYKKFEAASIELTAREADPPKCIGCRHGSHDYFSHAAAPMELIEVIPVSAPLSAEVVEAVWACSRAAFEASYEQVGGGQGGD